jgi:hypothetical protein
MPDMLNGLFVLGGFALIGFAAYGFWQGLKLKPHDKLPVGKGSHWRTYPGWYTVLMGMGRQSKSPEHSFRAFSGVTAYRGR